MDANRYTVGQDHYVEVTVRKTAELVVRAALAHMREVHREAH